MSGLVAILSEDGSVRGRGVQALDALRRLPADGALHWDDEAAFAGVCGRDGETSAEPGAAGSPAVAVAGEIINASSLGRELGCGGTDASTLVRAAYDRWGAGLFDHLEGCFALVLVDRGARLVLAGTDPFGVMSLYKLELGSDVLLATEAKAFLADPRFVPSLDDDALAALVTTGHDAGHDLFAGVRPLAQGAHLEVRDGRMHERRQWAPRDAIGDLRGDAYVDRLGEVMTSLGPEIFGQDPVLLPLTGGLDSRLLAGMSPEPARVRTVTFGGPSHADVRRAREIAALRGMGHETVPYETGYVRDHAAATVWFSEGRLTPVENITGFQMAAFPGATAFVSGVDSGVGRRYGKGRSIVPDARILTIDDRRFRQWASPRLLKAGMSGAELKLLFGDEGERLRSRGLESVDALLSDSRGLPAADRMDLYMTASRARSWRCAGLLLAGTWLAPRAPFFTRRWIDAVLAGAPEERLDDLARLRLVLHLDAELAAVPWVMTGLPLAASDRALAGLRRLARMQRAMAATQVKLATVDPQDTSRDREALYGQPIRAARSLYSHFYRYGDDRAAWLRGPSRSYLRLVLLDGRAATRGLARPDGVARLLDEHDAGKDHTYALSILLNLELWSRQFADGDGAPEEALKLARAPSPLAGRLAA